MNYVRVSILCFLTYAILRADTVTVSTEGSVDPITCCGSSEQLAVGTFDVSSEFPEVPTFDPTLGQLDSVTIDWEAQLLGYEHYLTVLLDGSLVPLNFSQTATFAVDGFSTTSTQSETVMVRNQICHGCGVGIPFDLKGQGVISDPSQLVPFITMEPSLPLIGLPVSATIMGETGDDSGAFLDTFDGGEFLDGYSMASWTIDVTYDYTSVPEPSEFMLICGLALTGLLFRSVLRLRTLP
jgi:hypothetical protein